MSRILNRILNTLPVRAKAFKLQAKHKAFALTGRLADCYYTQGAALGYGLLPFQGVLLWASALYFALPFGQRFSIPLRAGDRWFRVCCHGL